ncbi:hypothetical protein [Hoylesella enoeca]|uniref:Fimbrillin family protein n=2 Tax=Hoylesella enoeca TaxID=76123 RepID=A0A0S2KN68_9BACT|nr:hypothetical protein [Hoylesella enoeca]ALO49740.1 hypothetical protein AS203_12175 [Hoylesella enoeca]
MKKKSYLFNNTLAAALFVAVALTVDSCADNDLDNRNGEGNKSAAVSFDVKDVQEAVLADQASNATGSRAGEAASFNNQLCELGLTQADFEPQILEAQTPAGMEACLVETTIPGINPVQHDPQTRATVTKTLAADFSTLGYRATSPTAVSSTPDWFYNARTKSNGELYDKLYWNWDSNHFGRFYAVFPEVKTAYSKIKLSPNTHGGNPYVEFEADPDVANQKDLMTACSGVVEYQTRGVAPNTSLAFRHALTAVHFTVGQNLWAGQITKIKISGAISKGTYTLNSDPTQPGTWAPGSTTGTFTLDGININTATNPGSVITDDNGNYTFFMIPQQVTGKNIYVDIYFQDGKTIHVLLKGAWKAGTTKTYTLSNKQSNWDYKIEATDPAAIAYDQSQSTAYTIRSYRQAGSVQIPVAWKVIGYDNNGDGVFNMSEKPTWLTSLSLTEGHGGTAAETGTATVSTAQLIDKLKIRQNTLKAASPKGSAATPYNLSNANGGATVENTANSYVISAPGYYRIPLVYGNAIKGGATNSSAYQTTQTGSRILQHFKDHADQNITNPWITQTNGGANVPNGAKIVWADESGMVTNLSIVGSGTNAFLQFEVPASAIKTGNVVIAATKNGTVVWSWHLWFTEADVLNTIACTNFQNVVYNFTKEALGWKYTTWKVTTYDQPRSVKVKVEQTQANNGTKQEAVITITQNPGAVREGYTTLYQWGRKDALAGTDDIKEGSYSFDPITGMSGRSLGYAIQHPENMFNLCRIGSYIDGYYNWCVPNYDNLWSANNTVRGTVDAPVVKTIYDPCPVGFHTPASNAFTGFSKTGVQTAIQSEINAAGSWNFGYDFYNKLTSPDATIYFPASGNRNPSYNGDRTAVNTCAYSWTAVPYDSNNGYTFSSWTTTNLNPAYIYWRSLACPIRPAAE